MNFFKSIYNNIFFVVTLFLLAFIPLYPKLPLLNVQHTWVYVRIEDTIVALVFLFWIFLFFKKKVTLKTPLTLPILLFWIAGGLSTLHGVLLLFPTLSNVFSNVAFLSLLRRIEYMFLFFIAFGSIKDKKFIYHIVIFLIVILLSIVGYGFGQKFFHFPAYLTMNEEFAKGIPIQISNLSRVPSTFGGHYDLAAYLVLVIPILASLIFGFKKIIVKSILLISIALGFVLLFMTVSRVSFFVLLLSLVLLLFLQKKKWIIVTLLILVFFSLSFSSRLLDRFGNTVSEVTVLVDAKTGNAIKEAKEVNSSYFDNKIVVRDFIPKGESASTSAIVPHETLPKSAILAIEPNRPTGENLPQGTSYINLPLSPIVKKVGEYFYEKPNPKTGSESTEVRVVYGEFIIKKALAYDLSFTTRFQGEWPRTILAFTRNIFLGSGYGSVSLAVDNDYLRILGESGLLGFISFASIFVIAGIYIKKLLPRVDSPVVKSFVLGFVAGTFGLMLNGLLIDVFEASKIAFTYWLLMGTVLGLLHLYKKEDIDIFKDFKKVLYSPWAITIYLLIAVFALFSSVYDYYFVGDDFTWFRWVSDCYLTYSHECYSIPKTIITYFTQSNGFFYRPGTKLYFLLMYKSFWLNQDIYHFVSILLHFLTVVLVFLISRKILKSNLLSVISAFLFLVMSGHQEVVFWISATGFLFNAVFALSSLLFFSYWREKGRKIYLVISIICIVLGLLFHEMGIVTPLFVILYDIVFVDRDFLRKESKRLYLILLSPILPYLVLRFVAQSHWLAGDYSYNILKLPFNVIGNMLGYIALALFGPASLPFYQVLRNFSKVHSIIILPIFVILLIFFWKGYKNFSNNFNLEEKKIIVFGFLFFLLSLLPFLGLGNITSRYSYLSFVGLVILLAFFSKKMYSYFFYNGREIALALVVIVGIIFSSFHLFQLQRISIDWHAAGEESKTFLTSLDGVYSDYWAKEPMQFYFVNVPTRQGNAWVFPVGLNDGVWFVFRNEKIIVNKVSSLDEAFNLVEAGSRNQKVFEFQSDGSIVERKKKQVVR